MDEPATDYAPYKSRSEHDDVKKATVAYGRAKAHLIKVEAHYMKAREALEELKTIMDNQFLRSTLTKRKDDNDDS